MHIDFRHITVFYLKSFESFNCFAYYISNRFTYSHLSFIIFQQSLYYYNLAFLVIEMDKKLAEIIDV